MSGSHFVSFEKENEDARPHAPHVQGPEGKRPRGVEDVTRAFFR